MSINPMSSRLMSADAMRVIARLSEEAKREVESEVHAAITTTLLLLFVSEVAQDKEDPEEWARSMVEQATVFSKATLKDYSATEECTRRVYQGIVFDATRSALREQLGRLMEAIDYGRNKEDGDRK